MTKVILSQSQKEKAREAAHYIMENPDVTPHYFLDDWYKKPQASSRKKVDEKQKKVQVSMIVGTERRNIDRLVTGRIVPILGKLCDGEFEKNPPWEPKMLPHLEKVNGRYYVSADGTHRTLAHKILNIETMYAEVTCY
jgi:hypothetical protein